MEAERSFLESPSHSVGTLSSDHSSIHELQSMAWYKWFLKTQGQLLDGHIATALMRCRVLILSGTDLSDTHETDGEMNTVMNDDELRNKDVYRKDKNKAKLLEGSLKESSLTFKVIDMG